MMWEILNKGLIYMINNLTALKQWICHLNKIPKSPLYNGNASPTDPTTWGTYEQALQACKEYGYSGVGFVFTENTDFCGIDIDHCIDKNSGEINKNALDIINTMASYTEYSPSGTGVHIIYKGNIHDEWRKKKVNALGDGVHLEMYQKDRYFTFTGNRFNDKNIEYREDHAALIYQAYMQEEQPKTNQADKKRTVENISLSDTDLIEKAKAAKNGAKFQALFGGNYQTYCGSQSEADLSLCSMLAFWTQKEITQIDRIFRQSGLMRDKWDEKHGKITYGEMTISKAVESCTTMYDPKTEKTDYSVTIGNAADTEQPEPTELPIVLDDNTISNIISLARGNILDSEIFKTLKSLDIETFETLYDELLPLAIEQKRKTEFKERYKSIKKQIEQREKAAKLAEKQAERAAKQATLPVWVYLDKWLEPRINETKYISNFLEKYPLKYVNNKFYDFNGERADGDIMATVQTDSNLGIQNHFISDLANKTNKLFRALQNAAYCADILPEQNRIHFKNGILSVDEKGLFTEFEQGKKEIYTNNLVCNYNPSASQPTKFLKYLDELLEEDDKKTIQQYLGHLLIPTTELETSLYLMGEGQEGKSVIGKVIMSLFGDNNYYNAPVQEFDKSRFAMANLENKLFFLDDDVSNGAVQNSGIFKTLVTAKTSDNAKMYVERKGIQEHKAHIYARYLLFGNYPLFPLYESSLGFYRRFHYIKVKSKPKDRKIINNIQDIFLKEKEEKDGIVKWLVDGLNDLIKNNRKLYISSESTKRSNMLKFQNDTIRHFLADDRVMFNSNYKTPFTTLYRAYCDFCNDNSYESVNRNGFSSRINSMTAEYKIKTSNHVPTMENGSKKQVRGIVGIGLQNPPVPNTNYTNYNLEYSEEL